MYGSLGSSKAKQTDQAGKGMRKGFQGATLAKVNVSPQRWCIACQSKDCSSLFSCNALKARNPQQRFDLAKASKLCFNCLKGGHSSSECRAESTCTVQICRLKHTKLLHIPRNQDTLVSKVTGGFETEAPSSSASVSMCGTATAGRTSVALPVVKVTVTASNGCSADTFALLDSGSTSTFCPASLTEQLGSKGQTTNLNLTTLENNRNTLTSTVHELRVSDSQGHNSLVVHSYEVSSIPVSSDCTVNPFDHKRWDHLKDFNLSVVPEGQVKMLICQDHPEVPMPLETRTSQQSRGPYVIRTPFGWTVSGPLKKGNGEARVTFISLEHVEEFWKIEGMSTITKKGPSQEDRIATSIMQQSIELVDGHYSVSIRFREDSSLPNNQPLAQHRLDNLGKKLKRNPVVKQVYIENMEALIDKGHAEREFPKIN